VFYGCGLVSAPTRLLRRHLAEDFDIMRAKVCLISVVCLSLVSQGCLSTVRIKRDPLDATKKAKAQESEDAQGIPFYIKTASCKQQTIWLQPVYTLTLKRVITSKFEDEAAAKTAKAELPSPRVISSTKVLSLSQMDKDVVDLRALLSKPISAEQDVPSQKAQVDQIEDLWEKISAKPDYNPLKVSEDSLVASSDVFRAANTSSPEVLVDYSRMYYYNSPRPWVGSSQVGAKLASDGTLTEGSAQNQTQTLSTLISALPVSAVLTKVAELGVGAPVTGAVPGAAPIKIIRTASYDLGIQQQTYRHTHSRYVMPVTVPCAIAADGVACPVGAATSSCSYALQVETADTAGTKEDANAVKVNGTISLPKAPDKQ
jgi:hypothetical protein